MRRPLPKHPCSSGETEGQEKGTLKSARARGWQLVRASSPPACLERQEQSRGAAGWPCRSGQPKEGGRWPPDPSPSPARRRHSPRPPWLFWAE